MPAAHKIMLIGAGGQVGTAFLNSPLPANWQLLPIRRQDMDITNYQAVSAKLSAENPDLVINTAAMTNVDLCEKEQDAARDINFHAAGHIAQVCASISAPLIHLSTDYVFDGEKNSPYVETDEVHAINHYGFTKLLAEESVREEQPWHVIMRISWVFSQFGDNVLHRIIKALTTQTDAKMVVDQTTRPTPARAVVEAATVMAGKILSGKADGFGTFHFCATPTTSRFEFANAVAAHLREQGVRTANLHPCNSTDFPSPALRPLHSALDCGKIERVYGIKPPEWAAYVGPAVDAILKHNHPKEACA